MRKMIVIAILLVASAFYAYGAVVHVANMLSATGFDWPKAPFKWQALDVVYLVLDALVAVGLWRCWWLSIACFYVASFSQIALYTLGRGWVLDVPQEFRPPEESLRYLDTLVAFHLVALAAVTFALLLCRVGGRSS